MKYRAQMQIKEALGDLNRWYCSKFHGREITEKELLVRYFVTSGGAEDFCNRFAEALGQNNRWYCSQFHHREVLDEEMLWSYFMSHHFDEADDDDGKRKAEVEQESTTAMELTSNF